MSAADLELPPADGEAPPLTSEDIDKILRQLQPAITGCGCCARGRAACRGAAVATVASSWHSRRLAARRHRLGGSIEDLVLDPARGRVEVRFTGPDRLRKGIDMALRDDGRVKEVVFT